MAYYSDEFDCRRCPEAAREERGCYGPVGRPIYRLGDEEYDRCPVRLVEPWTHEVLVLYRHYKNGFLPYAGGVTDQPAKLMRAFLLIENAVSEAEAERAKKK